MSQLKKMLIRHEGYVRKPYRCLMGKLTIGVGHNLDDNGLSDAAIDFILEEDIMHATAFAIQVIPGFLVLNSARQDVIISMIFQLGTKGFFAFKRLREAIAQGDYTLAAKEMLSSLWAQQTPARAKELTQMMFEGKYPTDPTP